MGSENNSAAAAAASLISSANSQLTAPARPGEPILNPAVLDRLGIERRVLGFITDEVDKSALGARNTLHAITYALMNDPNTTHPPETHGRLEVDGKSVEEIAQRVLDILGGLIEKRLVSQHKDGSYKLTDAGQAELNS